MKPTSLCHIETDDDEIGTCKHGNPDDGDCLSCQHEAQDEADALAESRYEECEHMAIAGRLP